MGEGQVQKVINPLNNAPAKEDYGKVGKPSELIFISVENSSVLAPPVKLGFSLHPNFSSSTYIGGKVLPAVLRVLGVKTRRTTSPIRKADTIPTNIETNRNNHSVRELSCFISDFDIPIKRLSENIC